MESFESLCKSGIFSDAIDWYYEKDLTNKREYILDSGRMNPYAGNSVTVYLRKNDYTTDEEIGKALLFEEE